MGGRSDGSESDDSDSTGNSGGGRYKRNWKGHDNRRTHVFIMLRYLRFLVSIFYQRA